MTESEWLTCTDPAELVRFLRGRATDRKLRLFAVACCRRLGDRIAEESSRRAIRISEHYADGRATFEELEAAFLAADRAFSNPSREGGMWTYHAVDAARLATHPEMRGLADGTATAAAMAAAGSGGAFWERYASEQAHQCSLVRDVFGNPFCSVPINPSWLAWNHATVVKLAQGVYDDRAFDSLPLLADALEEAGCDNVDILSHCRQPGKHVRGCWVVDLILGKQ